ncbi:hypothetical protein EYC51_03495 [Alcaligenes faecalis]|nr:hypothetical protein EYC51_03495 [Alcaligenes faecalis]
MNNNFSTTDFNRACMAVSFGAIAFFGTLGGAEAAPQPSFLHDVAKFQVFENSQPTSQTRIIKQYLHSELIASFEEEYSWINAEIADFMSALNEGRFPEYDQDLLSLADEIMKNNPEALKRPL